MPPRPASPPPPHPSPPHPSLTRGEGGAKRRRLAALLGLAICLAAGISPVAGRGGQAAPAVGPMPAALPAPFPADIRPRFRLTDQTGRQVSEADFAGKPMAIFFGYANCEAICSVALPRLGGALDMLGDAAAGLAPILITVDPARDTPEAMRAALPKWHPRLIGLTGPEAALAEARAAFQIEARQVFDGPEGPVYSHAGFIYLFDRDGRLVSLLPPILGSERMAEIIAGYL
jgi:protein SCO1